MTEDDTFNALKRTSFDYLYEIWTTRKIDSPRDFVKSHGWDFDEFRNRVVERRFYANPKN